jgi:hypothetical protein
VDVLWRRMGDTVVEEVEAAIDPDAGVEDRLVFLGVCWPLAWLG